MMMQYKPTTKILLSAISLICVSAYANEQLDTVEVIASSSWNTGYSTIGTATPLGIPMTLKETPQSVSVINSKQIEDQKLGNLLNVLQQSTGITTRSLGSGVSGYGYIYARGYEVNNYLFDGVPLPSEAMSRSVAKNLNSHTFERVEILRGASALLGGTGEPAAQISVVRKRPSKQFAGEVNATVGSWNRYNGQLDLTGALNHDGSVRGRVALAHNGGNTAQVRAKTHESAFYGITEMDLSDKATLSLGMEWQQTKERGATPHGADIYDSEGYEVRLPRRSNAAANWSHTQLQRFNLFSDFSYRFNDDWQLKLAYSYDRKYRDQLFGVAGRDILHETKKSTLISGDDKERATTHSFSGTVNGQYSLFGKKHDLMFGVSGFQGKADNARYWLEDLETPNIIDFVRSGNIAQPVRSETGAVVSITKTAQTGGYFATRLHLADRLALTLGSRFSRYQSTETFQDGMKNSVNTHGWTPYAGVVLDLTDNIAVYTSFGRTFKPTANKDKHGNVLSPETGRNLEIGLKGAFFDERLNLSATAFETRKDNLAVFEGKNGLGEWYYRAEDRSKTKGYEVEAAGSLNDNWHINVSYAVAKPKDRNGKPLLTEVPTKQFKLFTTYDLLDHKLTLGGGVRWQNRIYEQKVFPLSGTPEATMRAKQLTQQKAYALVDLLATYRISKQLELSANVNNLFNKTYRQDLLSSDFGEERNFSASVRYRF